MDKEKHIYKSFLSPEILFYNIKYHLKSQHNLDDPEILETIHTVISNSFESKESKSEENGNAD